MGLFNRGSRPEPSMTDAGVESGKVKISTSEGWIVVDKDKPEEVRKAFHTLRNKKSK